MKHHVKNLANLLKNLYDDEITYYASSLSFYTIFTIIPLLLIVLSIFTYMPSFEDYYQSIKEIIFDSLMPTHTSAISEYIDQFLQNSGKLGVVGFVSVLIASMLFFQNYEFIVNKIYRSKQRSFWDSLSTYWTLVTLLPIALVVSFYLSSEINSLLNKSGISSAVNMINILPYLITWALFFVAFKISVFAKNSPALISSFATSTVWYIAKTIFVYYVFHNKTYSSLYGSFSILLFFFLWIYLSWIIYLYGIKLSYLIETNHNKDS